jgi:hypothetical protein
MFAKGRVAGQMGWIDTWGRARRMRAATKATIQSNEANGAKRFNRTMTPTEGTLRLVAQLWTTGRGASCAWCSCFPRAHAIEEVPIPAAVTWHSCHVSRARHRLRGRHRNRRRGWNIAKGHLRPLKVVSRRHCVGATQNERHAIFGRSDHHDLRVGRLR